MKKRKIKIYLAAICFCIVLLVLDVVAMVNVYRDMQDLDNQEQQNELDIQEVPNCSYL